MSLPEIVKTKLNQIKNQFPTNQALVIPALTMAQNELGWISRQTMQDIADHLELPVMKVREVATFYTMFNKEPVGKVHLQLCMNISCWLNGSEKLLHCLEKKLGIGCGETTQDGNYTLSEVECLASCGTAPVLQVNEDYYENLNETSLHELLEQIEQKIKNNDESIGKSTYKKEVWP